MPEFIKIVQKALALNSMTADQDLPTAGRFKVNVPSVNVLMNNGRLELCTLTNCLNNKITNWLIVQLRLTLPGK